MTRIVAIGGIRSQYMKLASLQYGVREWNRLGWDPVELVSINAGQHYDAVLSRQYCEEYQLSFDIDLTNLHSNNIPTRILASMIVSLSEELSSMKPPDFVVVFGDANTTLAGAIAARSTRQRLVHVEAGLRTYDQSSPEEANRIVADHLARHHFTSSRIDSEALVREGITDSVFSGDLIRDLITRFRPPVRLEVEPGSALVTIHREENTQDSSVIDAILTALEGRRFRTLFIAHPRVVASVDKWSSLMSHSNIAVIESVSHQRLLELLQTSEIVVTDSGALQREAYYLGRRILIYQNLPFWRSLVDSGFHRIITDSNYSLNAGLDWARSVWREELPNFRDFGDGYAARTIIRTLTDAKRTLQ